MQWIKGPSPEDLADSYANGRFTASVEIIKADDKSKRADELYNMCDGAFNTNSIECEFDRGIQDQLHALGYEAPYQNGQF